MGIPFGCGAALTESPPRPYFSGSVPSDVLPVDMLRHDFHEVPLPALGSPVYPPTRLTPQDLTMSNDLFAFLPKGDVPDRGQWQEAIDASGYSLELSLDLRPFESSGYLPCRLLGHDAGFEIAYGTATELAGEDWRDLAPEHADHCVTFSWGSAMAEGASAQIAAYALAARFGATVSFEGDEPLSLEDQAAEIQEFLAEIRD